MSRSRTDLEGTVIFWLPVLLTPAALIGIVWYFLDDYLGLHNAITIVLFCATTFAAYKYIPKKPLFGFGLAVTTLVVTLLVLRFTGDWIWAIFGGGLYLAIQWLMLHSVLGEFEGGHVDAEDEDDEPEVVAISRPKHAKERPASKDNGQKIVGSGIGGQEEGYIQIQFDRGKGSWVTVSSVMHNSQMITHGMKQAQRSHPGKRIRAIDKGGRLVDML